jgi:anti-sigma regulatory factor (Ser/Thr protein kinase)
VADAARDDGALRLPATVEAASQVYGWLDAAAAARALPEGMLFGMHVALEEAVMNVALHAFAPGAEGAIEVRLETIPGAAALIIEDDGPPFDPTAAAAPGRPASLATAGPGGRGLTLMRHYCRDMSYARTEGRNRLTLRFPLPG